MSVARKNVSGLHHPRPPTLTHRTHAKSPLRTQTGQQKLRAGVAQTKSLTGT
eukprot:COSAG01_NODE_11545_length_1907_cov_1.316372_1_plen_51_part_10